MYSHHRNHLYLMHTFLGGGTLKNAVGSVKPTAETRQQRLFLLFTHILMIRGLMNPQRRVASRVDKQGGREYPNVNRSASDLSDLWGVDVKGECNEKDADNGCGDRGDGGLDSRRAVPRKGLRQERARQVRNMRMQGRIKESRVQMRTVPVWQEGRASQRDKKGRVTDTCGP